MKHLRNLSVSSGAWVVLGFLLVVVGYVVFQLHQNQQTSQSASYGDDLEQLQLLSPTFSAYSDFFETTANTKGAIYAYDLLRQTPLPPNVDQHLLGHVVGDELYRQEGLAGMQYCTDDFRNACSHTIVIGALLDRGLEVFDEVNDICQLAPGGSGAYTMCFHGFGHGVLAYTGYDMPQAVELCMKTGTEEYFDREAHECVGGAVMEMKDGIHDKELWESQKAKYVDTENPLSLCQADFIPEAAKERCYAYITPYLFDAAGANGGLPRPNIFADSMAFCELEPDSVRQEQCYAGFGKEFIGLSVDHNINNIEAATDAELARNIAWCDLAPRSEAALLCKLEVVNSLYWGGENHFGVSVRYCNLFTNTFEQQRCFESLFVNVDTYTPDNTTRTALCNTVPITVQTSCRDMLL